MTDQIFTWCKDCSAWPLTEYLFRVRTVEPNHWSNIYSVYGLLSQTTVWIFAQCKKPIRLITDQILNICKACLAWSPASIHSVWELISCTTDIISIHCRPNIWYWLVGGLGVSRILMRACVSEWWRFQQIYNLLTDRVHDNLSCEESFMSEIE
jgi:hypothetical protein